MIIRLSELYAKQAILNKRIKNEHNLFDDDLFLDQVLALLVEIGEASNSSRHFKYWSTNQKPKEDLREEFVDVLHFGLSLGLEIGYHLGLVKAHIGSDLTTHTLLLAERVIQLAQARDPKIPKSLLIERYENMMQYLLGLGIMYGFSEEEIIEGYKEKFAENMSRQATGY